MYVNLRLIARDIGVKSPYHHFSWGEQALSADVFKFGDHIVPYNGGVVISLGFLLSETFLILFFHHFEYIHVRKLI
jgi:hypothetical protein